MAGSLFRKWGNTPQNDIEVFLNGLSEILANGKITKQEYLHWSKKLDRLRKEVESR